MKIQTKGVPRLQIPAVHLAIDLVDQLVWGGQINKKIKNITIFKDSTGKEGDPEIFKGLLDVYNPKTRTCELHVRSIINQGQDTDSNLVWSICHDLAHAFDVCYGNLSFNRKKETLTYMGREYIYKVKVNTYLPESVREMRNFRETLFYQAHDYYEPWEVRPLMAADSCMAEYRRGTLCPNLLTSKPIEDNISP